MKVPSSNACRVSLLRFHLLCCLPLSSHPLFLPETHLRRISLMSHMASNKHSDLEVAVVPQTYPMPYPVESNPYDRAESIERPRSTRNITGTYEKLNVSFTDAEIDRAQALPYRTRRRRAWPWIIAIVLVSCCQYAVDSLCYRR